MLTSRGLGAVLGDLASMGFDAKWGVLGAADVGANHQRDRIWIRGEATNPNRIGLQKPTNERQLEGQGSNQLQVEQPRDSSQMAHTQLMGWQERTSERGTFEDQERSSDIGHGSQAIGEGEIIANTECEGLEGRQDCGKQEVTWSRCGGAPIAHRDWWAVEPRLGRVAYGIPARMDRLKAIGNAQVPLCAATAWRILK